MADQTFTQADIDAAIEKIVGPLKESIAKLETKNDELIGENRKLKRGAEIKPEDLAAAEDRADKAERALVDSEKAVKALTTERDKAVKALEGEQGAARSYALEAEIASAIASGNVVPALVPAFKALVTQGAKADVVDGKYQVTIGDKPAAEHIKALLASDEGKHFVAAPNNTGGGSGGSGGAQGGAKTMTRSQFEALDQGARATFAKDGGQVVDQAA